MFAWRLCVALLAVAAAAAATTTTVAAAADGGDAATDGAVGRRVLVLVDDMAARASHSLFLGALERRGYALTVMTADDPTLALERFGAYLYDHLLLLCPAVEEFGGFVDVATILQFVDAGHNVLLAADADLGEPVRAVAAECGAEFDDAQTFVVDHQHFDVSDFDGDHTLIVADRVAPLAAVFGGGGGGGGGGAAAVPQRVLFRGIGHALDAANPLLVRLLRAAPSAYSHALGEPVDAAPATLGGATGLVSALQARNNARVVIAGSLEMFSDAFFKADVLRYAGDAAPPASAFARSDNERFALAVAQWTLQERGRLRAHSVAHGHLDAGAAAARAGDYRVKDRIFYDVTIEQYDGAARRWQPYVADDVQLEFIMLDPYVRLFLNHTTNGRYRAEFTLPDHYGVFTFKTTYHRPGYSHLETITRVPVRPFRHDEFERFIPAAFPYYASALSMLGGLFLFSVVFLFHKERAVV